LSITLSAFDHCEGASGARIDPWEKAAECALAIQISIDPNRKAVLTNLQQMWIALVINAIF
jgi:hypothetical protein